MKCLICDKTSQRLGYHISMVHKITSQEYYDKYLKKGNEGFCLNCKKSTNFKSFIRKYDKYCSTKCAAIYRNKIGKPWNYGLTKETDERITKPWNKDKIFVPRRNRKCLTCGKNFEVGITSNRKYCSLNCCSNNKEYKKAQSLSHQGKPNKYKFPTKDIDCLICKKSFPVISTSSRKYCSKECYYISQRSSLYNTERICPICGKIFKITNLKNKRFCSKVCFGRDEESRKNISNSVKRVWRERPGLFLKPASISPNKPESKLIELFLQNTLPFEYVGNGKFWVTVDKEHLNPDFVDRKTKQVIELYGNYWHQNDDPNDRIDLFKQRGFDCLVIWEKDLMDEESVLKKIKSFVNKEQIKIC